MGFIAKKLEPVGPPTFGESFDTLRSNGYAPMPVAWQAGAAPVGPWAKYQLLQHGPEHAEQGVAILTSLPSVKGDQGSAGIANAPGTHLVGLHVDVRDRKVAAEIDAMVRERLQWVEGVEPKSPYRVASDGTTFRPFALAVDAAFSPLLTQRYLFPGDKSRSYDFVPHSASIISRAGFFVVSGNDASGRAYVWKGGDLLTVPRSALPILDAAGAYALIDDLETILRTRGTHWG